MKTPTKKKKRGPGRPPKPVNNVNNLPKRGILTEPIVRAESETDKRIVELTYGNPTAFHKMFKLVKGLGVKYIDFHFTKKNLIIATHDKTGKNEVYIRMHGSEMHGYYCKHSSVNLRISSYISQFLHFTDTIGTNYAEMQLYLTEALGPGRLHFALREIGGDGTRDGYFNVDEGSRIPATFVLRVRASMGYPLKFHLKTDYMKKIIKHYEKMTDSIVIYHARDSDEIQFRVTYTGSGALDRNRHPSKSCDLEYTPVSEDDDMFATKVQINSIKPIAKSAIGGHIFFRADQVLPLLSEIYLDCESYRGTGKNKIPVPRTEKIKIQIFTKIDSDS